MKRLHVNLSVTDMEKSINFYTTLFSAAPDIVKDDYAKWMLDDPRVNFAISNHGKQDGLDHLGIQVENDQELHEVYDRLKSADAKVIETGATTCCYAESEKSWIFDPDNVAWETFLTHGESPIYGTDDLIPADASCCDKPESNRQDACC